MTGKLAGHKTFCSFARVKTDSFGYYALNKPYGYLAQFSDADGNPGLGQLLELPRDVYPVGRLDKDSEGLLLLTNDNRLKHRLLDPIEGHVREYWVQVEGVPTSKDLSRFARPMVLNYKGKKHTTRSAKARFISPHLPERVPPVRFRQNIPTTWISMELKEGKNRQVRKMTAHLGYPTLRLIRVRFGPIHLGQLEAGKIRSVSAEELKLLRSW